MYPGDPMELESALKECGALLYGEFTLSSGERSDYYLDIKKASTRPEVLREMAASMAALMESRGLGCDRLAGVVLGSIPLVVALSLQTGLPYLMVRGGRKAHGTGRSVEGELEAGERVIVVEDVITSAGSAAGAVEELRGQGATVTDLLAVVDRESGGSDRLRGMGVTLHPLLTASVLLEGRDGV